jgi:magnesium-transporting ATPase (P-type)
VLSPMDDARIDELRQEYEHLSRDGFRVLAIASKDVEPSGEPPTMDAMTRRTSSSSICGRKKLGEQFEGEY